MKLYNTLTRTIEKFEPVKAGEVGLYTCGPTVYNYAHIGNLRNYIFEDILKRALMFSGYKVKHVMNITDLDDKIIKACNGEKSNYVELTKKYEEAFFADIKKLNIISPNKVAYASKYIDKIVIFVSDLIEKGYAYKSDDGSVYFSISKFKNYGKLSRLDKEGIKAGARVSQDEYEKENPADFVLWKAWNASDGEIFWETPLGRGRPGWHIECSVMSNDTLGETIDIHAGSVDLIFPHHENEIAQSEAKTGKKPVNFWIHGEHLIVDGKKMSKSLNNFYILSDLESRGFNPVDFRYFVLGAHYRSKLNFTWEGISAAKNTRNRLIRILDETITNESRVNRVAADKFNKAVFNDLDVPQGLAILWKILRDDKIAKGEKRGTVMYMDEILGLGLSKTDKIEIPKNIKQIAEERKFARKAGDFKLSDQLRKELGQRGYEIEDLARNEYRVIKRS